MQIVMVAIKDLVPYARNSRTHSAEQLAEIAASIREFGFTNPVLTDGNGGIIAGHGRVLAAEMEGLVEVATLQGTGEAFAGLSASSGTGGEQ